MASTCISRCVDDTRVPVRATYVNLYKWPESDFEFVRSMSSTSSSSSVPRRNGHDRIYGHPRVVDSFSCRQLYLRSYTFSREEDYANHNKPINCLGRRHKDRPKPKEKPPPAHAKKNKNNSPADGSRRKRAASCSVLASVFRRLLSCTTRIDVVN